MLDAQQIGDESMAAGLFDDTLAGIDENDGQIRGAGSGDHVARVLNVARGVRDDEFPLGSGEIAVGNINGDALLALCFQAIREQREVHVFIAAAFGKAFHGFDLILEGVFGIVEQAADEG